MIILTDLLAERVAYLKRPANVKTLTYLQVTTAVYINRALSAYLKIVNGKSADMSRAAIKEVMVALALKYEGRDITEIEQAIKTLSAE